MRCLLGWCKKQYSASGPNGESVIKTKKWFGFRLHLIADAIYELPVAFTVAKASNSEQTETQKLLEKIEKEWGQWLKECRYFLGDKGYDSTEIINRREGQGSGRGGRKQVCSGGFIGTTGLHAILTMIGVKLGEMVIILSFTFIASANAVAHCGAIPWLMDINIDDWCMDAELVRVELEKTVLFREKASSIRRRDAGWRDGCEPEEGDTEIL